MKYSLFVNSPIIKYLGSGNNWVTEKLLRMWESKKDEEGMEPNYVDTLHSKTNTVYLKYRWWCKKNTCSILPNNNITQ